MISDFPTTAASGKPPPIDFATAIRSGSMPYCSHAKNVPVRPNPVCISSAIKRIPCASAMRRSSGKKSRRRRNEAALAEHRLDDDRRDAIGRTTD